MPRKDVDPEAVYTVQEIRQIVQVARAESPLAFALVAWCYEFGARTAEPGLQLLRDLDLTNNRARPTHLKGGAAKSWHFLMPFCQEALPAWLQVRQVRTPEQREYLFPSAFPGMCYTCHGTGQRHKLLRLPDGSRAQGPAVPCHHCEATGKRWGVDRREVYNVVARVLRKAGMPKGRQHPHTLRHSIITHMHNAKVEAKVIQDRVGHRRLESTLGYIRATDAQRMAVLDKMQEVYGS